MVKDVGLLARLSLLKDQEQAEASSGNPLVYNGQIVLNPILLDHALLCARLETGGFELVFNRTHSNLVFHHIAGVLHKMALLVREATAMVGRPFRPVSGGEFSLSDLTFVAAPGSSLIDRAEDGEERGSHGDPDQADTGELATSD